MSEKFAIAKVKGREVLDSRGNPTVEVEIHLKGGAYGRAMVPSGASTGQFEAVELRDSEKRYGGKGTRQAIANVEGKIAKELVGKNVLRQSILDSKIIGLDGTEQKANLGANAILGTSMALAKAGANALNLPLYRYIGGINGSKMPVPMMNVINGGAHVQTNSLDCQEFMILPLGAENFKEGMRWCAEVYQKLRQILVKKKMSVAVGDEGGFAPDLATEEEAIELLLEAITAAGYTYGRRKDFMISIDVAASEWCHGDKKNNCCVEGVCGMQTEYVYHLPKAGKNYITSQLISHWESIIDKYPIYSIEDPLDEEDWDGWKEMTKRVGNKVLLVGDDLFVTNKKRLLKGIDMGAANAILIKPNQIGSVSETMETVRIAKEHGYKTIMSHRSGETEDTTIADLAVGLNTGLIKTGAPCRAERTAKYNRLLRIEEELGL